MYGVFSVTGTPEAFLPYDLCSAFVNIFWIVLQLWVICQSVSEKSNSRCTAIVAWLELAGFPAFRLHEFTEIRFLEHSAADSSLREISRDTSSGNLIIEEVSSWEIKVQISVWGFGCWVIFWFYSCGVSWFGIASLESFLKLFTIIFYLTQGCANCLNTLSWVFIPVLIFCSIGWCRWVEWCLLGQESHLLCLVCHQVGQGCRTRTMVRV